MLHAAVIGFPSSGKSTLFQLMTSAKDAPRGHGKTETAVGISRVPDARLDRLTAMYNPRKRVPATIEFTDIVAPGRGGAAALVDVAGYKNADALVHVVRAFRDESVPPASGSVDPARDAQAMEDELILADLGLVERRLERLDKDLKKTKTAEVERERELIVRCRTALENGQPLRALGLAGDDRRRLRGFQFLSAKPLLLVINLDEADVGRRRQRGRRRGAHRADRIPHRAPTPAPSPSAPRSSSRSRPSRPPTRRRSSPISACANQASTG